MIISNRAITAFGDSRKGSRRQENEDRFLFKAINDTSLLLAISDGMGGNPAGAKAADDVIHSFSSPKNEENNSLLLRTAVHPMAHVLDQCIGCMDAGVDSGSFSLFPVDILLLCTDGIYRSVSNSRIQDILATTVDVKDCVEQLLTSSPRTVSSDDATVIVAFV